MKRSSFEYGQSDVHLRYDAGRTLPPDATQALMDALRRHSPHPVELVVDLGCGTGRFSAALSDAFCAPVLAFDPASNMIARAEAKPHPQTVRFVQGSADRIPLDGGAADLVFMSQVFHHLVDRAAAFKEIRRVLNRDGRLALRQTTRENLDSYFYQRFFLEARQLDERRLPYRDGLMSLARECGYRLVALETLRSEIAVTSEEYVAKIGLRTYSDLECISDEAFRAGLRALTAYAEASPGYPKFAENDLFVFETT
jgi:ubiquinone/menaquinone biosynthesis C-methylase UbiE